MTGPVGEEVDQENLARKHTDLRDRLASIKLQFDVLARANAKPGNEWSKRLNSHKPCKNTSENADYATKPPILEIVFELHPGRRKRCIYRETILRNARRRA